MAYSSSTCSPHRQAAFLVRPFMGIPTRARLVSRPAKRSQIKTTSQFSWANPTALPEGHMNSKWPTGVPPQMGGHLLPSGQYAPLSTSTTCGTGKPHIFQYYEEGQADIDVLVFKDSVAGGDGLAQLVAEASAKAISERGIFTIAISSPATSSAIKSISCNAQNAQPAPKKSPATGGFDWGDYKRPTTSFWGDDPPAVPEPTPAPTPVNQTIEFEKWHVLFASEECQDQPNFEAAQEAFLSACPVPADQIYTIEAPFGEQAAQMYNTRLNYLPPSVPRNGSFPCVDMVLLEINEKGGSVAGLYPNLLSASSVVAANVVAVKEPTTGRDIVSFSLPMINSAGQVAMIAFGSQKAEIVSRMLEIQALPGSLPAQMIKPAGKLSVLIDDASAVELTPDAWTDWKRWPRSEVPKPEKK